MHTRNLHRVRTHFVRAPAPSRFVAGILVTLALLSAACSNSDPASRINAPPLLSSLDESHSAAASNFAVLANAAVTCTDGKITGNVGTFLATPPGAITLTNCPLTGSTHIGDAASIAAYRAFLSTYAALAPKTTDVCPIITGTLDGQNLAPGVYCVSSEAKTGTLTLTGPANGTWIIKVPSGALTGTNFHVVMAGRAQACNVTWWVDAAATMTTSTFQGNILAGAGITTKGGTFNGNAWAGASGVGDVTITGTVVTGCASSNSNGNGDDKGDKDRDKDKDKDRDNHKDKDHGDSDRHHGDDDGGHHGESDHDGGH